MTHERGRCSDRDRQEPSIGERSNNTSTNEEYEDRGDRADDVADSEYDNAREEHAPRGPPPGEGSHGRCADDHSDCERRRQQTGDSDRDIETRSNVGHQAGEHEFRSAHGEDSQGKQIERKRHRILRGERTSGDVSSPRSAPGPVPPAKKRQEGTRVMHQGAGKEDSVAPGANGVAESPHSGCLRARHVTHTTRGHPARTPISCASAITASVQAAC